MVSGGGKQDPSFPEFEKQEGRQNNSKAKGKPGKLDPRHGSTQNATAAANGELFDAVEMLLRLWCLGFGNDPMIHGIGFDYVLRLKEGHPDMLLLLLLVHLGNVIR